MKYNVHAGHAKTGGGASGAVGYLNESDEARYVKRVVKKRLEKKGHTVYDCTVNTGTQNQVLSGIVRKANAHKVNLDVSIHFNSGVREKKKNGKTTGVEVFVYSDDSRAKAAAERVCKAVEHFGFKNRGVKYSKTLYVLRKTNSPAMLIEVCFVDDADDAMYYKANKKRLATAIADAIAGDAS